MVVAKISVWKSLPKLLNMVNKAAKTEAISGPIYGIIFKTAHKNAIINAFGIPKIIKTIKYKIKTINNCNNNPMK